MDINKKISQHMEKIAKCEEFINDLKEAIEEAELQINVCKAQLWDLGRNPKQLAMQKVGLEWKIDLLKNDQNMWRGAIKEKEKRLKFLKRMWVPI